MISPGKPTVELDDILKITTEASIAGKYLGISNIPCLIKSPIRADNNPSFAIYSPDGTKVRYIDFATKETGGIFDLLCKMWNENFTDTLVRIYNDNAMFINKSTGITAKSNVLFFTISSLSKLYKSFNTAILRFSLEIFKLCKYLSYFS